MRTTRALLRILLISLWTAALLPIWAVGILFRLHDPMRRTAWRGRMTSRWARGVARIAGMRIQVTGTPPQAPFVLVANHLSYFDVILLQTRIQGTFVAKAEVKAWPFIGWLTRTVGTLFIDRKNRKDIFRVNALVEEALQRGDGIVFFPEGTSSKGDKVYPFKASLLDLAARRHSAVVPAAISYRTPPGETPAHLAVCWWGEMTFADHLLNLLKLPYFEATLVFGSESIQETDRKVLARKLKQQVQSYFFPVVTPDLS